jgi:hypothetical protein
MEIRNAKELQAAILQLENKKEIRKELLVEHFHETYEHFKPINLLKNSLKDVDLSAAAVGSTLTSAGLSAAAGFLSKKLFVGSSNNIFKRTLGLAVELGVANLVAKHSTEIKEKGMGFLKSFIQHKEKEQDSL